MSYNRLQGARKRQHVARAGFTLIELLVVVLIIGVLSAVAFPQYENAVEKARAAEGLTVLKAMMQAQQAYYLANGSYSLDLDALDLQWPGEDNGIRKDTKYFSYRGGDGLGYGVKDSIAVAHRKPMWSTYYLIGFRDGSMKCVYSSDKGKSICALLGVKNNAGEYVLN